MSKKTKWELNLHQARELRKQGAGLLFDRVSLLVACYEDDEFRSWHADQGTSELDALDDELSDVATGFLTLRAVLAANPDREAWIKHNIRDLIALAIEAEAEAHRRDNEDTKRISWKERALMAEQECERLRARIETLEQTLGIVAGAKCA